MGYIVVKFQKRSTKIKIDLHIHSKYSSDGVLDPRDIVSIAKSRSLDGIAVTDHNTIRGGKEAKKHETQEFQVVVGAEIMTDIGEVTGLFLHREIESRCFLDVIDEIKSQDGVIVIPHPFDRLRRSSSQIKDEHANVVDAIEIFNSRCVLNSFNRRALEFAKRHNLSIVAGSDAHFANEIGLGGIVTYTDDIREAIMAGELTTFGKRTPLSNHVRTKIVKLMRSTTT